MGTRDRREREHRWQRALRVPAAAKRPRRGDVVGTWRAVRARQVVGEPGEVAAITVGVVVVVPRAPLVARDRVREEDRPVRHVAREVRVQQVELPVAVIAPEREVRHAVERRRADHQLVVLRLAAVVPDRGAHVVREEARVGGVGGSARTEEVLPSLEVAVGVVRQAAGGVPQADRVAAVRDHVGVQQRDARGRAAAPDRELMVVVSVQRAVVVPDGHVRDDEVRDPITHVHDRGAPVVGVAQLPVASQFRVLEARVVAILAHDRDPVLRDEDLLLVETSPHEDGAVALAAVRQRVERGLDGGEVAGPVLRDDDVRTFAGMGGACRPGVRPCQERRGDRREEQGGCDRTRRQREEEPG